MPGFINYAVNVGCSAALPFGGTSTSYSFYSGLAIGGLTGSSTSTYVGGIPFNGTGGSNCESIAGAAGSVSMSCHRNSLAAVGLAESILPVDPPHVQSGIGCSITGSFIRIGTTVIVLAGNLAPRLDALGAPPLFPSGAVTLDLQVGSTDQIDMLVAIGEFVPDSLPGQNTSAAFAGSWASV
jgi:hypothetical protein